MLGLPLKWTLLYDKRSQIQHFMLSCTPTSPSVLKFLSFYINWSMFDWQSTKNHNGLGAVWGHRARGSPQQQPQLPQTCLQENKPAGDTKTTLKIQSKNTAVNVAINILHLWLFSCTYLCICIYSSWEQSLDSQLLWGGGCVQLQWLCQNKGGRILLTSAGRVELSLPFSIYNRGVVRSFG